MCIAGRDLRAIGWYLGSLNPMYPMSDEDKALQERCSKAWYRRVYNSASLKLKIEEKKNAIK